VDENESVLETVAQLLIENDHTVTTASSLEQARQLVTRQEFDLVVADWQMTLQVERRSPVSGKGANDYGLGSRVLWMSSVSEDTDGSIRDLPQGAAVLLKPFQPGELLAAVDASLSRLAAPLVRD